MSQYDVAIIGGGAAGLSAALVLAARAAPSLVVDAGAPRNAPAAHMHGYLSRDGLPPTELLALGRSEVSGYGGDAPRRHRRPRSRPRNHGFTRSPRRRAAGLGAALLVTTGLRDELPDIPGLRDRWARDVLHCPYCHGHEVRDRQLGVLGGEPGAVRYAQIVRQWTDDLVYFTPPDPSPPPNAPSCGARAIGIVEGTIERARHRRDDRLRGVRMDDGCVVPRDALFVPPRFVPNNRLLLDLGCAVDADGWVVVDTTGRTSVPGVWAAGNVVDPRAQVITAAGAGSATAIALNADLVDDDVRVALG